MYVYQEKLEYKRFYKKRFESLYPMFWMAYIIAFIGLFYLNKGMFLQAPKKNFILTIIGFDGYLAANVPTFYILGEWFLGCIILFYVLFPLLRTGVNKYPKATVVVTAMIYLAFIFFYHGVFDMSKIVFVRMPEFLMGMYFIKYIKKVNPSVVYHVDAIQAFGKLEIKPRRDNIDLLTVSGHKIHGPKGSGFIYIKKNTKINPIIFGGGQQMGFRSGTENVPGIAGIGQASKDCYDNLEHNVEIMTNLKDKLIDSLEAIEGVTVNSRKGNLGAPHIVSASFKGVRSEVLLHALEDKGIYISAGSACSSNRPAVSSTLKAMGIDKDLLESTVRFSFCEFNTEEEVDYAVGEIKQLLPILRKYVRR